MPVKHLFEIYSWKHLVNVNIYPWCSVKYLYSNIRSSRIYTSSTSEIYSKAHQSVQIGLVKILTITTDFKNFFSRDSSTIRGRDHRRESASADENHHYSPVYHHNQTISWTCHAAFSTHHLVCHFWIQILCQ